MKTLTIRQFAAVKRVAQNVNFAVTKRNKISEQISKLTEEYNMLEAEIEGHEAGIKALTGYTSEDLVTKVVTITDKQDKEGRPIKVTKYEPKEGIVVYNESTKVYEIHDSHEEIVEEESISSESEINTETNEEDSANTATEFTEEDKENIPFM